MKTHKILNLIMTFIFAFPFLGVPMNVLAQSQDGHFNLGRNTNTLHLYGWPLGATLTVSFDDLTNGLGGTDFQITPIAVSENGFNVYFDGEFDVDAGDLITVTDETTSVAHVVKNLAILSANPDTNIVTGIAEPGTPVWVGSCDINSPLTGQIVNPDSSGIWEVDFSADDLQPDYNIVALQSDGYGNNTQWDFHVFNSHIEASPTDNLVDVRGWPLGNIVTLTIDNPSTQQSPDYTATQTVGPAPWNPTGNAVVFDLNGIFHYQVGDLITVSDGSLTKVHTVEYVAVTSVDLITDTVSGIADPGAEVQVNIHGDGAPYRKVIAPVDGRWTVNFAVPWNDQGTYDLTDFNGAAYRYDDDGDASRADFPTPKTPRIQVNIDDYWVQTSEWPAGALLTMTISASEVTYSAQSTVGYFDLPQTLNLQPGDVITITDGITTKTYTIAPVQVTNIDVGADTIAGTATPGSQVEVHTNTGGCCTGRLVITDEAGNWFADFHNLIFVDPNHPGTVDLIAGSGGQAVEANDEGNETWIDWVAPNPIIEVNMTGIWIQTQEYVFPPVQAKWPLGTSLTLTVDDPSNGGGIDYTAATVVDHNSNGQGRSIQTQANFAWPDIGLQPGFIVTVTGNGISKTLVISPLKVDTIDVQADTIAGKANPGATIQVCTSIPNDCIRRSVIADHYSANWLADYHNPGTLPEEQQTVDITSGTSGRAVESDGDGDQTLVEWRVPNPRFNAVLDENTIYGFEWPDGDLITLIIDDPFTTQNPDFTETKTAIVTSEDINQAVVSFELGSLMLRPGMLVTMTDNITIKTHTIIGFGWTEINYTMDIVSGIAESGMEIYIWIFDETEGTVRHFLPNADGHWTASFAVPGDEPYEAILDLHPMMSGGMTQIDSDGDQTQIDWVDISMALGQPPVANAGPDLIAYVGGMVTLSASTSSDPNGDVLTYAWDLDNNGLYEASGVTTTTSFNQIGDHTIVLRVTDSGGLSDTDTVTVTVLPWTLKGFYQPVDMNGVYNLVKGGSTVPLKFEIFAGATELTDIAYIKRLAYAQTSCDATAITDEIETTATGNTSLRNADGQFIYNWKTPKTAGKCYRLTMITIEGSSLVAYFKLK